MVRGLHLKSIVGGQLFLSLRRSVFTFAVIKSCLLPAFLLLACLSSRDVWAQSESATLSGVIRDARGAVVPDVEVTLTRIETGTASTAKTNGAGIYILPGLHPGHFRLYARKPGFKEVIVQGIELNVQTKLEENLSLEVGSVSESITVTGGAPLVNTEDATVSTVVDRNFAENLPLNGRSFQTLIDLTPGVVPVVAGGGLGYDTGQFSVNGQRAASNYWMVDGVSANSSANTGNGGNQLAGATGIVSVLGGTNSLVPVDDMQEFRIQTSTFAPEFGRTPGAQISIVTRSGNNSFHGSAFDYFRNDILDANNWFNGYTNPTPLPKAQERQNDFGGTLGGPILKNRTFFFFSYEGLRLRLPTTTLTTVPDLPSRQSAVIAMQPVLNAYPFDPSQPNLGNGLAQFNASYSNPGTLNDYNLRIDHKLTDHLSVFGRYNYSPSKLSNRGELSFPISDVFKHSSVAQQLTSGFTWGVSSRIFDEFRFNWSKTDASGNSTLDSFGGAVPWVLSVPSPYKTEESNVGAFIFSLSHGALIAGPATRTVQHQINFVDTTTVQLGSHNLKFGVDYRRLTPASLSFTYSQIGLFFNVAQAETGNSFFTQLSQAQDSQFLFQNFGSFVQDAWRVTPDLTLTYGLRWDIDFAPSSISGPPVTALANFNRNDLSSVTLAPLGTSPFHTDFTNIAPRLGLAYHLSSQTNWDRVVRGGFGMFYDLATSEMGNIFLNAGYPYLASDLHFGSPFPLTGIAAAPPAITAPTTTTPGTSAGIDPNLKAPYTWEWNAAFEQQLGLQQTLSLSYVGAIGRRLLQTTEFIPTAAGQLNPAFTQLIFTTNSSTSDYHALQIKFERRLQKNLQLLSSYTWSHSIDTASAGSAGIATNRKAGPGDNTDRASSDFDIRHSFTLGSSYRLPALNLDRVVRQVTSGWSLQTIVEARTAPPVTVVDGKFFQPASPYTFPTRPDVLPGVPLYLYGPQYPGGKAFNNVPGVCADGSPSVGPFCHPPTDANGTLLRQGNLGRNALRGFGAVQWNLGVHREFPIHESFGLQFRAEMFNVLNHPNFGPPAQDINASNFGKSTQMLNDYLGGGTGSGLNPLYQIGGPRSVQLALKFMF